MRTPQIYDNMKKIVFASILALILSASSLFAKDYITKKVDIPEFNAITCNIPCEINYSSSSKVKCEVTMPENLAKDLSIEVKDGELLISLEANKYLKVGKVEFVLSSEWLDAINLNGAVDFEADGGMESHNLGVSMNGASKLEIDSLKAKDIDITINGTGKVEIDKMKCGDVKVTVNGAGGCKLEGKANKADLTVNGVGNIDIKKLDVDSVYSSINGIGSITRSKN